MNDLFVIKIGFAESEGDPARVFHAMGSIIDNIVTIDKSLAGMIDENFTVELLLEDVEKGSLKAILRSVLQNVPDDALSELDVKKIIGHFLVKAKYKIIEWCNETKKLSNIEQVRVLEGELITLAEQTRLNHVLGYTPLDTKYLLQQIGNLKRSMEFLEESDSIVFESFLGIVEYDQGFEIDDDLIEEILTREQIASTGTRLVKVKKPDYLGKSRWVLRYMGRSIEAKFEDESWLHDFQNKKVVLGPGDSLKVILEEIIYYGYDSEIVSAKYAIKQVISVVPAPTFTQQGLFF